MIDLRSDTLTLPDDKMLEYMLQAPVGDSGRLDKDGYGDDPSVNALCDYAAALLKKERAIFLPSGTLANHVALLTWCSAGDEVLVERGSHIYNVEKAAFESRFGQLEPIFYKQDKTGTLDIEGLEQAILSNNPKLICIENTHNSLGGCCISLSDMERLAQIASREKIPVHMDGARLFNAATALGVDASEICKYVDSVMFCVSKGLGAPIGSILCGSKEFILKASSTQKLLGGCMRQAGSIAAAGLYALKHNIETLRVDHLRAKYVCEQLQGLEYISAPKEIQSNIIVLDVVQTGVPVQEFIEKAKEKGLWLSVSSGIRARMVFHKNITDEQVHQVVEIMKSLDKKY
ncbi:MAG: threonine aldolase family protein [Lachnospiraceae bacterium]|nr:threonine aldolase family protein [Lachnospiraceae bacterium]